MTVPSMEAPSVDLGYRPTYASMRRLDADTADRARREAAGPVGLERVARSRVRPPEFFEGRTGLDRGHLGGFAVGMPTPTGARARDVLPVGDDATGRLDYTHFSVVMSRSRRMAMTVGVNIEGLRSVSIERDGDKWFLDGRIPVTAQIGEDLYAGNRLDRGHLVRREDPNWGEEAEVANEDTFHFTNCAPQMDVVNQRTWLGLENYILRNARAWKERCTVFTGPVFGPSDIPYRGILVPKSFWKVVAFLSDEGKPSATAYVVEQDKELGQLEAAFGAYKTYQRSVSAVQRATGLDFGDLAVFDGLSNEEALNGAEIAAEIRTLGDVRV